MADDALRTSLFRLIGAVEMHEHARRGRGFELTDLDQRLYQLAREEAGRHPEPQDQEGRKLTRDDGERLGGIATSIEETFKLFGAPVTDNVSRDLRYLRQLARSALQDSGGTE